MSSISKNATTVRSCLAIGSKLLKILNDQTFFIHYYFTTILDLDVYIIKSKSILSEKDFSAISVIAVLD